MASISQLLGGVTLAAGRPNPSGANSSASIHGLFRLKLNGSGRKVIRCVQQQQQQQQHEAPGEESSSRKSAEDLGEVDSILGSRVWEGSKMQYLIRWKDDHPDSWEPAENIAADVLSEYILPWWKAARAADESSLSELLSSGDREVNAVDEKGRTALLFAAGLGSEASVRLLAEAGADLDWQDGDGFTALHIAAGYVQPGIVKALLELGADPDVEDSKGRTPLKLAQDLLERIPRANPLQFARRLALDQVVRLLDQASFEVVTVDQILDKRVAAGSKIEYLVRWSDGAQDSWLPAADISSDLVADYEAGLEYGVVEAILDKRVLEDGRVEYLVKWNDSDKDSWEPEDNVDAELVQEFERSRIESSD